MPQVDQPKFSFNNGGKIDFSQLLAVPTDDICDSNTAEGRLEKAKQEEEDRRNTAADICIKKFSSMDEHITHWPVNIEFLYK